MDPDGNERRRLEGYLPKEEFQAFLESGLARIAFMAIVDRNILRLSVYEFLFEETPHTVVINEALEIARRFSTFEATQFINGILDAIKLDLEKTEDGAKEQTASNAKA